MEFVIKAKVANRNDGSERWLVVAVYDNWAKCYETITKLMAGRLKTNLQVDIHSKDTGRACPSSILEEEDG